MHTFQGETADEVWRQAFNALTQPGYAQRQSSRNGVTSELLHSSFSISNPRSRWVFSRIPAMNPAFAIAEFFWILAGSDDANFINRWFPNLSKFQGQGDTYYGAYGHRLRSSFGFDQLEQAYQALSENPDSRQVVLQIWKPELDFTNNDGSPRSADIPCNICAMPKVRGERLEWLQVMRSNDLFRGMPYNIVQFTMLQETLAGWLGLEPGEYHQVSDSLHLYERDLVRCADDGEAPELTFDIMSLSKAEHGRVLKETLKVLNILAGENLSEEVFRSTLSSLDLPQAYENLISIAAADIARRENWIDTMNSTLALCSNSSLRRIWEKWSKRNSTGETFMGT